MPRMNLPADKKIVKILIVDDHPVVREGLSTLISRQPDLSVCGEAEGCAEAVTLFDATEPDLVIVDIAPLKDGNGIDLIKRTASRAMSPFASLGFLDARRGPLRRARLRSRCPWGTSASRKPPMRSSKPSTEYLMARSTSAEPHG